MPATRPWAAGTVQRVSAFDTSAFAGTLAWAGGALVVVLLATFVASKIAGKHSVIDTTWGLLFVTVAVVVFVRSSGHGDDAAPLAAAGPAGRCGGCGWPCTSAAARSASPRTRATRSCWTRRPGNGDLYALRMIYLLQGVLAFVIASPILVGGFEARPGRRPGLDRRRRLGRRACSSRASATRRWSASAPTRPTRARSSTSGCGATPGTRTTSATPACGGASSWSPPTRCPAWSRLRAGHHDAAADRWARARASSRST